MNLCEKLAATYLRLNGFLLLPQFTVFTGRQHNHVDLVGLRAANSAEEVEGQELLRDGDLFDHLTAVRNENAGISLIGIAVEVRTNTNREFSSEDHLAYVRRFFGGVRVTALAFSESEEGITRVGEGIAIGLRHAYDWIYLRFDSMERQHLTKDGSWNWSDPFLSDLLALRRTRLTRREK